MIEITNISGRLGNQMFQLAYIKAQELDGKIDNLYVQDPKYFDHHRDYIKAMFGQDIVPIDQVAIHIRRGKNPHLDSEPAYCDNSFYINLMDDGYYERAMDEFQGEEFVVFSDDIEWCKKQPIFKGCEFSNGNELEDLNRMAGCKGIIMANSSYSWWGAYLGREKKVIAPKHWYADGITRTKLLASWKTV